MPPPNLSWATSSMTVWKVTFGHEPTSVAFN
jgi:hypothetical protein